MHSPPAGCSDPPADPPLSTKSAPPATLAPSPRASSVTALARLVTPRRSCRVSVTSLPLLLLLPLLMAVFRSCSAGIDSSCVAAQPTLQRLRTGATPTTNLCTCKAMQTGCRYFIWGNGEGVSIFGPNSGAFACEQILLRIVHWRQRRRGSGAALEALGQSRSDLKLIQLLHPDACDPFHLIACMHTDVVEGSLVGHLTTQRCNIWTNGTSV